jgi:hypothetical protein
VAPVPPVEFKGMELLAPFELHAEASAATASAATKRRLCLKVKFPPPGPKRPGNAEREGDKRGTSFAYRPDSVFYPAGRSVPCAGAEVGDLPRLGSSLDLLDAADVPPVPRVDADDVALIDEKRNRNGRPGL